MDYSKKHLASVCVFMTVMGLGLVAEVFAEERYLYERSAQLDTRGKQMRDRYEAKHCKIYVQCMRRASPNPAVYNERAIALCIEEMEKKGISCGLD